MYLAALIVPVLMSAAAAEEAPITVQGYPWAPFISPMGEPFRGGRTGEAPIARWFGRADGNRDGVISSVEMQADADRFFGRLDGNRDGQIDPEEIKAYEWEIAPEIQVNSEWRRARGEAAAQPKERADRAGDEPRRGDQYDGYHIDGLQGAARYALLNIPQPVASADADFNRLITLGEFRRAAAYRFKLLDDHRLGRLTLQELEARLPDRPKGRRAKRRKEAPDTRIGLPLPEGD
ncbi:MAG: EF-hand domain-containing protein [Pseudomonadota bacterium]|nr:EF-hand domain-containing protein [Pseudomonadota bacterium]